MPYHRMPLWQKTASTFDGAGDAKRSSASSSWNKPAPRLLGTELVTVSLSTASSLLCDFGSCCVDFSTAVSCDAVWSDGAAASAAADLTHVGLSMCCVGFTAAADSTHVGLSMCCVGFTAENSGLDGTACTHKQHTTSAYWHSSQYLISTTTTTTTTRITTFRFCLTGHTRYCQVPHRSSKAEPLGIACSTFLQDGCPFSHPTNSVNTGLLVGSIYCFWHHWRSKGC